MTVMLKNPTAVLVIMRVNETYGKVKQAVGKVLWERAKMAMGNVVSFKTSDVEWALYHGDGVKLTPTSVTYVSYIVKLLGGEKKRSALTTFIVPMSDLLRKAKETSLDEWLKLYSEHLDKLENGDAQ